MKDAKPCPFCGGKPKIKSFIFGMEKESRYGIVCEKCGIAIGWEEAEDDAVTAWNRRANEDH